VGGQGGQCHEQDECGARTCPSDLENSCHPSHRLCRCIFRSHSDFKLTTCFCKR
jgi:hypothetical protein